MQPMSDGMVYEVTFLDTVAGAIPEAVRDEVLAAAALLVAVVLSLVVYKAVVYLLGRWSERTETDFDNIAVKHWRGPLMILIPMLVVHGLADSLAIPEGLLRLLKHGTSIAIMLSATWFGYRTVAVFRDVLLARFDISVKDNLKARRVYTQIRVLERLVNVVITIIAVACVLMTFDQVRQLGTSLLASAGLVSLILGFAAQKSLATLVSGLQIALSQPVRIDDVVIVEGEYGRIEEITLTYVVVRIWDQRRLIVPITYFIDHVFQNWTRVSAEILGTVYLYTDYTVPVEAVRQELQRILEGSELWDRRVSGLLVTNATDRTLELRALMSAADSSAAWDLRCLVREKLVAFLQQHYPQALPRVRASITGAQPAPRPEEE